MLKNLFTYPLGLVSSALSCLGEINRKTCKSKLHEVAMYDISIVEENKLPAKSVMNRYFNFSINLAACASTILNDCVTIRDLAWRVYNFINNQFETICVVKKCKKGCAVLACSIC